LKNIKQGEKRSKEKKREGKGKRGVFWRKWDFAGLDFTNRR